MSTMGARWWGPVAILLASTSCSSSSSSPSGPSQSETLAFSYLTNLISTQVTVQGSSGTAFVDTGNPFILLSTSTYPSVSSLPAGGGTVPQVVVGGQSVSGPYVIPATAADGLVSPDPAFPLDGNVGCTGICTFVATFDYRTATFSLGSARPASPAGVETDVAVPFTFEGGSVVSGVTVPKSRVVVDVNVEGTMYSMIVDTGASSVTVSQTVYAALTADGRAQLMGGSVETTSGTSTSTITRAKSMIVGGVEVDSLLVTHDTSFDTNLQAISTDVGHTIDGSLGGDFLHDFHLTIDYPATTLHFERYTDLSFAVDQAEQIGISLEQQGSQWTVAAVSSTAAAKGVSAGDMVVAIDGVDLDGLDLAQGLVPLYGPVGATKQVKFGQAAQVANQTIALPVEEFLPL
jgi:hypothetical protein